MTQYIAIRQLLKQIQCLGLFTFCAGLPAAEARCSVTAFLKSRIAKRYPKECGKQPLFDERAAGKVSARETQTGQANRVRSIAFQEVSSKAKAS